MSRRCGALMCVVALLWAAPAWAQSGGTPSTGSKLGGRLFGHFEWQTMTAKDSVEAVTGKSTLRGPGGGAEVQRLWRGVFARVAVSRLPQAGQRVFVFENEVFPLGIPLDLTLIPIEAALGWRFKPIGSRGIVPYLGGGALFLKYKESSEADTSGEDINETYNGFVVFGGLEVPVWRSLSAGGEVGWRKAEVKSPGGALDAFGEKDLGGVTMRVMLSISR